VEKVGIPVYVINTNELHWTLYYAGFFFEVFNNNGTILFRASEARMDRVRDKVALFGNVAVSLFDLYAHAKAIENRDPKYSIIVNDCQSFCMKLGKCIGITDLHVRIQSKFTSRVSMTTIEYSKSISLYDNLLHDRTQFQEFLSSRSSRLTPGSVPERPPKAVIIVMIGVSSCRINLGVKWFNNTRTSNHHENYSAAEKFFGQAGIKIPPEEELYELEEKEEYLYLKNLFLSYFPDQEKLFNLGWMLENLSSQIASNIQPLQMACHQLEVAANSLGIPFQVVRETLSLSNLGIESSVHFLQKWINIVNQYLD